MQPVRLQCQVQLVQDAAGTETDPALGDVDFQNLVEVLGAIEDQAGADRLAGLRGAAAARRQGNPELAACPVTINVVGPGMAMTTAAAAAKASQSWNEIMALLPFRSRGSPAKTEGATTRNLVFVRPLIGS